MRVLFLFLVLSAQLSVLKGQIHVASKLSMRCGKDWEEANTKCGTLCSVSEEECTKEENCYGQLSTNACKSEGSSQKIIKPTKGTNHKANPASIRCGKTWEDAAANCYDSCDALTNDPCDTSLGFYCYGGLNAAQCEGQSDDILEALVAFTGGGGGVFGGGTSGNTPTSGPDNEKGDDNEPDKVTDIFDSSSDIIVTVVVSTFGLAAVVFLSVYVNKRRTRVVEKKKQKAIGSYQVDEQDQPEPMSNENPMFRATTTESENTTSETNEGDEHLVSIVTRKEL